MTKYKTIRLIVEYNWSEDTHSMYVMKYDKDSKPMNVELNKYCEENRVRIVSIFNDGVNRYPIALVEEVIDTPVC